MAVLAKRLKQLRERAGIQSQQALATELNVAKNRIWGYEKSHTLPDIDFLARFAQTTGADLWELIRLRLDAGGFEDQAAVLQESHGEYSVHAGSGQRLDCAAHARSSLMAQPQFDPSWSLAIMELATRGDISPSGVDRLIDFIQQQQAKSTRESDGDC